MDKIIKKIKTAVHNDDKIQIIELFNQLASQIKKHPLKEEFWSEHITEKGNILQTAAYYCSEKNIIELLQLDQDNNPTFPIQALQQPTNQNENFLSILIINNKIKVLVKIINMYGDKVFFDYMNIDTTNIHRPNSYSIDFLSQLTHEAYHHGCVPFIKYLLVKGYIEAFKQFINTNEYEYEENNSQKSEEQASINRLLVHYLPFFHQQNDWNDKLKIDYLYKNENFHYSDNNLLSIEDFIFQAEEQKGNIKNQKNKEKIDDNNDDFIPSASTHDSYHPLFYTSFSHRPADSTAEANYLLFHLPIKVLSLIENKLNNPSDNSNRNDETRIYALLEQAELCTNNGNSDFYENEIRILVSQFMNLQIKDCLILFLKLDQELFFDVQDKIKKLHTLEEGALSLFTPIKVFASFEMTCHLEKIFQQISSLKSFVQDKAGINCYYGCFSICYVLYPGLLLLSFVFAMIYINPLIVEIFLPCSIAPILIFVTCIILWEKVYNKLPLRFFIDQQNGIPELEKLLTLLKDSFLFEYDPAFLRLQNNKASLEDFENIIDKALTLTNKPCDMFVKDWVENAHSNENYASATMTFFHTRYCQKKANAHITIPIPDTSRSSSSNERTPLLQV